MLIKGKHISFKQVLCLALYYGVAQYLPSSHSALISGGVKLDISCAEESLQGVETM